MGVINKRTRFGSGNAIDERMGDPWIGNPWVRGYWDCGSLWIAEDFCGKGAFDAVLFQFQKA